MGRCHQESVRQRPLSSDSSARANGWLGAVRLEDLPR